MENQQEMNIIHSWVKCCLMYIVFISDMYPSVCIRLMLTAMVGEPNLLIFFIPLTKLAAENVDKGNFSRDLLILECSGPMPHSLYNMFCICTTFPTLIDFLSFNSCNSTSIFPISFASHFLMLQHFRD